MKFFTTSSPLCKALPTVCLTEFTVLVTPFPKSEFATLSYNPLKPSFNFLSQFGTKKFKQFFAMYDECLLEGVYLSGALVVFFIF